MPTLNNGESLALWLDPQDSVSVTNATVWGPFGPVVVTGATVFGPYVTGAHVRIVGNAGCTFTLTNNNVASDQGLTAAQVAALGAVAAGSGVPSVPGQALVLKAFTGRSQLTGGTPATKTPLMEIPIPDGWLSRIDVRMDIEASFNWTNNANTKEWGIALGASSLSGGTVAGSVDLRTISFTTTASIADKMVVGRSAETPTRLYLALPNNSRIFGVNATTGTTVGVLASVSINPDATGQSLWVWGRIANAADQISLEHLFVQLQRGAA